MHQFELDQRTIDAVIRNLEIIGGASHHIPDTNYTTISIRSLERYEEYSYS